MENDEVKKFDLENSVSGGPLETDEKGNFKVNNLDLALTNLVKEKDLLIHIQYFPDEDRYGFAIYQEKYRGLSRGI